MLPHYHCLCTLDGFLVSHKVEIQSQASCVSTQPQGSSDEDLIKLYPLSFSILFKEFLKDLEEYSTLLCQTSFYHFLKLEQLPLYSDIIKLALVHVYLSHVRIPFL